MILVFFQNAVLGKHGHLRQTRNSWISILFSWGRVRREISQGARECRFDWDDARLIGLHWFCVHPETALMDHVVVSEAGCRCRNRNRKKTDITCRTVPARNTSS
jgi:hypothetical protein